MTHDYYASITHYSYLSGGIAAWSLFLNASLGVAKNDTINVIEIDNGGTPTGNSMSGTVRFLIGDGDLMFDANLVLIFVIKD